jgi:hypothetical protein
MGSGTWKCTQRCAGANTDGTVNAGGGVRIARLYLDDVIVAEGAFERLSPMLRTAHYSHAIVRKENGSALLINGLDLENDRRQTLRTEVGSTWWPPGERRGSVERSAQRHQLVTREFIECG